MNALEENTAPTTEINLDQADPGFKKEVAQRHGAANIKLCYACGACSARCPVTQVHPEFDPRRLIRRVILGLREDVLQSPLLWLCSTCFTCQETCPQGVGFTEVLFALKNMAAEKGCLPPGMNAQTDLLKDHGRLYEIGEFENQKRVESGLPELPERPEDFKTLLDQFHLPPREED
jgi:heterodisulfide reductase subunit C2